MAILASHHLLSRHMMTGCRRQRTPPPPAGQRYAGQGTFTRPQAYGRCAAGAQPFNVPGIFHADDDEEFLAYVANLLADIGAHCRNARKRRPAAASPMPRACRRLMREGQYHVLSYMHTDWLAAISPQYYFRLARC